MHERRVWTPAHHRTRWRPAARCNGTLPWALSRTFAKRQTGGAGPLGQLPIPSHHVMPCSRIPAHRPASEQCQLPAWSGPSWHSGVPAGLPGSRVQGLRLLHPWLPSRRHKASTACSRSPAVCLLMLPAAGDAVRCMVYAHLAQLLREAPRPALILLAHRSHTLPTCPKRCPQVEFGDKPGGPFLLTRSATLVGSQHAAARTHPAMPRGSCTAPTQSKPAGSWASSMARALLHGIFPCRRQRLF